MEWEADLIHGLQKMSNGFTDALFFGLTYLGDELCVVAVMAFIYWCVSKKTGFKFLNVYFLSSAVNIIIKAVVCRPRPYTAYPDRVRSIYGDTGGYSFPSGHTNNIATLSTLACTSFKDKLKIFLPVGIGVTLLVMFTRLFLGQHYFTDVVISAALACGMVFLFSFLYGFLGDGEERIGYVGLPLAVIATIVVCLIPVDGETRKHILEITGVMASVYIGYYADKKYIGFNERATVRQNILKLLIGVAGAAAIYFGLRYAFYWDDTVYLLYGFARFFLLGAWMSLFAPMIFKKLGLEKKDGADKLAQNG